ncbi:hypothetical protein K6W16_18540 [Burkholderia dolosa]|uniref:Glycosyltransferase (GlcNAc) n=1 Tax=Burkholderia dolosa TaxID=152500 RepID=A0A892ICB9_9BURK|nr:MULTISPECIES: GlcNAc-transferase family protein [Burkholderia]AKE06146.1 hypothetical protein XM57_26700 [Burkholderia cepacia]AJY09792.1 glycosyltransferase family protein [Burkholderia dolosa AU0158]EAY70752.1 hypothetical protein BDAG_03559 [Burkholderia dolosa AU0158]ETP62767.1 hypothetical protein BDSB_20840 [Burkholderia dolosa PC543]MBR8419657.1 hypothetical protein [Burkholderia dolosa]
MSHDIFVQIASYRDPQLIPTLIDLIEQSRRPEALRIVVCWQHAPDETIDEFLRHGFALYSVETAAGFTLRVLGLNGATVELIDVPHFRSQGVCWARNLIQQCYRNETYTLQLDSHHRFVKDWDALLVDMIESLRAESPKPVLTTYPPDFDPHDDPASRIMWPTVMTFERFTWEGFPMLNTRYIADSERARPVRGRFYAAGFAFADGSFAVDVQHDPNYFFYGEEMSIAVRAYTYGYDFYHPNVLILWHEYARPDRRPKIWGDHNDEAKRDGHVERGWWDRAQESRKRFLSLFGMAGGEHIDPGRYGFGNVRSVTDYERYAGISFAHRGVHRAALEGTAPVADNRHTLPESEWLESLQRSNDIRICLHQSDLRHCETAASARLRVFDQNDAELNVHAISGDALRNSVASGWFEHLWPFMCSIDRVPLRYTLELLSDREAPLATVERRIAA